MPWKVRHKPIKSGKDWAIMKKVDGKWKVDGRSSSKRAAEASARIRRKASGH